MQLKERIQLNQLNTTIEDDDIIILNSLFQLPFLCHCDHEPAATSGKEGGGHTLPWLIVCVISIVFGILAILGKSLSILLFSSLIPIFSSEKVCQSLYFPPPCLVIQTFSSDYMFPVKNPALKKSCENRLHFFSLDLEKSFSISHSSLETQV